jgi:ComF family protein
MIRVKTILNDFAHLFFPHICAGCGTDILNQESQLCLRCIDQLPVTNFHLHSGNPVEKNFWGRIPVTHATAYCHFTGESLIQHLLHQLKYKGNKELGYFLGRMMGNTLRLSNHFNEVDALIPLPLFAAREKKRGYNQAGILCDGMAQVMRLPVIKDAVIRLSATETQTHKNRVERWQNMEGRFQLATSSAISDKHLLLIDDVVTTGATLEACGQELLQAKNIRLSIATLAYTV